MNISTFPQTLFKAREKAVLGDYISSINIYKSLTKNIQEYTKNLNDKYLISKWKELYEKIMLESSLIYKAYNLCRVFKENSFDDQFKKVEEQNLNSNKILMREFKIDHKRSYNFDNRKNNFNFVVNNYVIEKKYKDDEFLNKDPDVWEDPENDPRFPGDEYYYKNVNRRRSNKSPIKFESNVVNYEELEKKRNYEKPWKVNNVVKPKNNNKNNNNNNNKNNNNNNNNKNNNNNIIIIIIIKIIIIIIITTTTKVHFYSPAIQTTMAVVQTLI